MSAFQWLSRVYSVETVTIGNYTRYVVYDETGRAYSVESKPVFEEFLELASGSKNSFFWDKNTRIYIGRRHTIDYYVGGFKRDPFSTFDLFMPLGKVTGGTGHIGTQGPAATNQLKEGPSKPGDKPWDPWAPPPPGGQEGKYEVKKPGDTPWDPIAPPPPGSSNISGAHWLPSAINHLQN